MSSKDSFVCYTAAPPEECANRVNVKLLKLDEQNPLDRHLVGMHSITLYGCCFRTSSVLLDIPSACQFSIKDEEAFKHKANNC